VSLDALKKVLEKKGATLNDEVAKNRITDMPLRVKQGIDAIQQYILRDGLTPEQFH